VPFPAGFESYYQLQYHSQEHLLKSAGPTAQETNLNVHHWLMAFMQKHPIPRVRLLLLGTVCEACRAAHRVCHTVLGMTWLQQTPMHASAVHCVRFDKPCPAWVQQDGAWDDVSGETFLRTLLTMPIQEAKYSVVRSSTL